MRKTKTCSQCKKRKRLDCFHQHKKTHDGRRPECKVCSKLSRQKWRTPEWNRQQAQKYRKRRPEVILCMSARGRAKKRGLEYRLKPEDLLPLPTHCPVLGIPLRVEVKAHSDNSYTLDRRDNSKGYLADNVLVVSYRANRLKSDATPAELVALARFYGV